MSYTNGGKESLNFGAVFTRNPMKDQERTSAPAEALQSRTKKKKFNMKICTHKTHSSETTAAGGGGSKNTQIHRTIHMFNNHTPVEK